MYICLECGATFNYPEVWRDRETGGGESFCPECKSDEYEEANLCWCGNWKPEREFVCEECRERIKGDLKNFFGKYGEMEKVYIAEILEDYI